MMRMVHLLLRMKRYSSFDAVAVEHGEPMAAYCDSCRQMKTVEVVVVAMSAAIVAAADDVKGNQIQQPTVMRRKSN